MTAPIDPARAEAHARHNVAGQGTVVATSVVAALLDLLDAERAKVRDLTVENQRIRTPIT